MSAAYLRHFVPLLGGGEGLDLPPPPFPLPPIYLMSMKEWIESNDINRIKDLLRAARNANTQSAHTHSRRGGGGSVAGAGD